MVPQGSWHPAPASYNNLFHSFVFWGENFENFITLSRSRFKPNHFRLVLPRFGEKTLVFCIFANDFYENFTQKQTFPNN